MGNILADHLLYLPVEGSIVDEAQGKMTRGMVITRTNTARSPARESIPALLRMYGTKAQESKDEDTGK